MKSSNKVQVKFKLDKYRFVRLEVDESKIEIVRKNNREISRNEKREMRHETMYSIESISDGEWEEFADVGMNVEDKIIEQESVALRNQRLYAAMGKLSPAQQKVIRKVYFEEKTQKEAAKELGITAGTLSLTLTRAIRNLKKFLEK